MSSKRRRDRKAEKNLLRRINRRSRNQEARRNEGAERGSGHGDAVNQTKELGSVGHSHHHFKDQSSEVLFSSSLREHPSDASRKNMQDLVFHHE